MVGIQWIVDAHGCDPTALRDRSRLQRVLDRCVNDLALTAVGPAAWHTFPAPGGLTGFVVLAESHVSCHSFPEFGSLCLDVFCCRPRGEWNAAAMLRAELGASDVSVRRVEREYGVVPRAASMAGER